MSISETRSSIVLILATGLLAFPAFAADSVVSDAEEAAVAPVEPVASDSSFTGVSGAALGRDAITGSGQRAVTAGYELGGSGVASGLLPIQGGILTSPGKGHPVRFDNGIFLYPSAVAGFGHNDNLLGTPNNRISSYFWVVQPELVGEFRRGNSRYTLSYLGNYGRYEGSSADDYEHHELWAAGDNYFTSRIRLGWGLGYLEKTDARGATNRAISSEPDRWHAPVARLLGMYGAPGARAGIEAESSWMQKRYDNNRAATSASDVDQTMLAGRFRYRVMPKTSLLLEARNTWANYVEPGTTNADNTDFRIYAGLTWEATAKTLGTIKWGRAYKNFSGTPRDDASLGSWEARVRWSPLTYSTLDLVSSRTPVDPTGVGDFSIDTSTSLAWQHRWTSFLSSRLVAGVTNSKYPGDAANRKDETTNYGFGLFSDLGPRVRVGVDWSHTDRNSSVDTSDFKRNVVMATLEVRL